MSAFAKLFMNFALTLSPWEVSMPDMNDNYLNRDLSWLEFNRRVLHQAYDESLPLLERVRFLSIFNSNLDEFVMKRIGYLNRLILRGVNRVAADDISPNYLLQQVRQEVDSLSQERDEYLESTIIPELKNIGVEVLDWAELTTEEKESTKLYFRENIFPILTPLAIDPAHPFPFLSNLSFSLAIQLHAPKKQESLYARLKVPDILPQWHRLPSDEERFRMVPLYQIIENHLGELFPDMSIEAVMAFRVTRNADIKTVSDDVEDLLDVVEEELRQRRLAESIRLEYSSSTIKPMLRLMQRELELEEEDLYKVSGSFIHHSLGEIANLPLSEHHYSPWVPVMPPDLKDDSGNMMDIIKNKDILVHHPYESFSASVEHFLKDAVNDPDVYAIKMTLYRTDDNSPLIPLLIQAAEKGKQVVVVVELKARFDEARNIYWGEVLENAGVHVVYGVVGLKTHSKIALVIRKEKDRFRLYSHIGTGNYNSSTAKLYTDIGLFTSDKKITSEVVQVFNYLTGLSAKKDYKHLLVSPVNMRSRFIELIKAEIQNHKNGKPAKIIAKMNSLQDREIIDELYKASQAGVEIQLIVRGFCSLRPGVPGLSDNIRVYSTVGRFLEHSRIYYFQNAAEREPDGLFYIGSADWMYRNLNKRVEVISPIEAPELKAELWHLLDANLHDKRLTWKLLSDGTYEQPKDLQASGLHDYFMQYYKKR
tara:strand:+ start:5364 stop:7481 length:2118 start_codon:yes stop_codon:yes gene_type:complete